MNCIVPLVKQALLQMLTAVNCHRMNTYILIDIAVIIAETMLIFKFLLEQVYQPEYAQQS